MYRRRGLTDLVAVCYRAIALMNRPQHEGVAEACGLLAAAVQKAEE